MTKSLLWKLLGINILIIGFVIIIVWLSVNYLAAGYFMTLMEKYNISPTSSHQMFVSRFIGTSFGPVWPRSCWPACSVSCS